MENKEVVTNAIKMPNKDLEILKNHFPHCFDKNGNFLLEKFQQNLVEKEINFSKESYGLDWLGKSYARLLACDSATTLLKEDERFNAKPENENSRNLLIKGDNLEVLKHLSNCYHEKIKMIYIDPPYNTGSDGFVYQDDRKFTAKELQILAGVDEEKARRILDFTKNKSNSHSAWLTFMYPRLFIAKQLLKDDGVIFISIDDNEVAQLRLLMDEIFGEENFVSEIVWVNNERGRSIDKFISNTTEHIFVFAKKIELLSINQKKETGSHILEEYNQKDNLSYYKKGDPLFNNNSKFNIQTRPNLVYSIYVNKITNEKKCIDEKIKNNTGLWFLPIENLQGEDWIKVTPPLRNTNNLIGCWRWGITKFIAENEQELLFIKENSGKHMFYTKNRLDENEAKISKFKNIINGITSSSATVEITSLLRGKFFDYPKPIKLIKELLKIPTSFSDIILDFFGGSGTTGDAVMQLNAEDGGSRQFILVQVAEEIDARKNKDAYDFVKNELKMTEPTIFEITKERLIRAAKKINEEQKTKNNLFNEASKLDLGFKIFETMPIWEDYNFEADKFKAQQELFNVEKLSEEDIKSLLITWKTYDGIALTQGLENVNLNGYISHYANGKLYLINKGFTTTNLIALLEKIDSDKNFNPNLIIAYGYHFDSKNLREIAENVKSYSNKKKIDIDFVKRY